MNPQNPFDQLHQDQQPPQGQQGQSQQEQTKLNVNNPLSVMQPDEQVICEIRRHPIGMLGIYAAAGGLLIVLAVLIFVLGPSIFNTAGHTQVFAGGGLIFIFAAIIILAFVFISNKVYWGNHWIVTSDSITQVTQTSLFSRQSAQLSLGNLEDVTSEQNGILAEVFHFGVLKAETAGERSKFMFLYCPNPNYYAKKILAAREVFEREHHGGKQEPYKPPIELPAQPGGPEYGQPQEQSLPRPDFLDQQPAPVQQPAPPAPVFPNQPPTFNQQAETGEKHEDSQEESEEQSAETKPSSYPDSDQPVGGVSTNTHVD